MIFEKWTKTASYCLGAFTDRKQTWHLTEGRMGCKTFRKEGDNALCTDYHGTGEQFSGPVINMSDPAGISRD